MEVPVMTTAQATSDYEESPGTSEPAHSRHAQHLCVACGSRPARFQYRGVVKADRDHTLCFRCYRSAVDSIRNVEIPTGRIAWLPSTRLPAAVERALEADKYQELARRRHRAQIAARHALELQ
jgi:hypothetical protein